MSAVVKQSLVSLPLLSKEQSCIQIICPFPQLEAGSLQLPRTLQQPDKMLYNMFLVKHFFPKETRKQCMASIYLFFFSNTCHQLAMFSFLFYVRDGDILTTKLQL